MVVRRARSRVGRPQGNSFSLRVTGGEQLTDLGRRLSAVDKHLAKELRSGLARAAKPLIVAVRAEIPPVMPKGYEQPLSRSLKIRTQVRTGRNAAVRITAVARGRGQNRHIRALDKGILRHPLFGDREWWYSQPIRPGFWTRPMRAGAPAVRREMVKVMTDVADKITKG